MIINGKKQYGVFELEKSRKTYSDHNVILLILNLIIVIEKKQEQNFYEMCIQKNIGTNWHRSR